MADDGNEAGGGVGVFDYAGVLMMVSDLRADECVEAMRLFFKVHHADRQARCDECLAVGAIRVLASSDRVWREVLVGADAIRVVE